MTDIINAEQEHSKSEEPKMLTVGYLRESLAEFPQGAEVVAAMTGIQLTIPIVGAIVVNTREGKQLAVLQISAAAAKRALLYVDKVMGEQNIANEQIQEGEAVN